MNYIYIYQVIMWYTLTIYSGTYQLYLHQTGGDPVLSRCEAQKIRGWFCKTLLSPFQCFPLTSLMLSCWQGWDPSTNAGCYYDFLPPSPFPDSFSRQQYAYWDEWLLIGRLSIPKANHFGHNRARTPTHFSWTLKTLKFYPRRLGFITVLHSG